MFLEFLILSKMGRNGRLLQRHLNVKFTPVLLENYFISGFPNKPTAFFIEQVFHLLLQVCDLGVPGLCEERAAAPVSRVSRGRTEIFTLSFH